MILICNIYIEKGKQKTPLYQYVDNPPNEQPGLVHSLYPLFSTFLARTKGAKLECSILDASGTVVPPSEYSVEVDGEDWAFNFNYPYRPRSGRQDMVR